MSITWYEDNSMEIEHTIDGSGSAATMSASIFDAAGTEVWTGELEPTGTDDHYAATVHPEGTADLAAGARYRLHVEGSYGGAVLDSEEWFTPRVRRTS